MSSANLPESIASILTGSSDPATVFSTLLPALGEVLQCDRCFLYLRHPPTRFGKTPFCWRRNLQVPEVLDRDWSLEPATLAAEDPLFAAGLRLAPSVFVEDVETAAPEVLNRDFERQQFGHRALIHSHLHYDNQFWGVLQPCIFGRPRPWSEFDRSVIHQVEQRIAPLAAAYVTAYVTANGPVGVGE